MAVTDNREQYKGETGYSWLFFSGGHTWFLRFVIILLGAGLGGAFYVWYTRYNSDASPDSFLGYAYAIIGTSFLLLAAFLYTLHRRSHNKRAIGRLNTSLSWHICFGVLGLVFLFFHSFGNFNPRSGTYALYAMIALTMSGIVGRLLDRVVPRLIAGEVHKALTAQGDDRIESISQKLQAIVIHNSQDLRGFTPVAGGKSKASNSLVPLSGTISNGFPFVYKDRPLHTPWDLAYISLEETPQKLSCEENRSRLIANGQDILPHHGTGISGAPEQLSAARRTAG